MARAERRTRRGAAPGAPPDSGHDGPNGDLTGANRIVKEGSASQERARQRYRSRLALVVAIVLMLGLGANFVYTRIVAQSVVSEAVDRAEAARLNGAAQDQARDAVTEARPALDRLRVEGLPLLDVPPAGTGPAFRSIASAAAAEVLADMDPGAVRRPDFAALDRAIGRYYARHPVITASGPTRLDVTATASNYMLRAAER